MSTEQKRVKGQALLDLAKKMKGSPLSAILDAAGYYTMRDGQKTYNRLDYFRESAKAQGLEFEDDVSSGGAGREPTFELKVGTNGTVPIGRCYTGLLGLEAGEYVKVVHLEANKPYKAPPEGALVMEVLIEADQSASQGKTLQAVA